VRHLVVVALACVGLWAAPAGAVPAGKGAKPKDAKPAEAKGKPAEVKPAAGAKPGEAPKPGAAPAAAAPVVAAPKPATYEELLTSATSPQDLAVLLEPLFATCPKDSDLAFRQCETIKTWHLARIHSTRYTASADKAALQSQPYDPSEKSLTLTIAGCLSCLKPPELAGSPRLVATRAPKGFAEGAPIGLDLAFHEVPLPDAKKAEKFVEKVLPRLRVEYVFTVGEPFDAGKGDKALHGVTIVPIAHRVYNQCTGEVLESQPASKQPKTIPVRDPTCPAADAPTEEELAEQAEQAALPDTLTRDDIERAMAPAEAMVIECAAEFELKGVAKVSLVVSPDGTAKFKIQPPFDTGEASLCLKQALKLAKFPKFKKGRVIPVDNYPFQMRK
jgi:hypothetical protein